MTAQDSAARDPGGRFRPGHSGNPKGKQPGTLNRATVFKQMLRDGQPEAAAQHIIDRAVEGDMVAARFLFDRIDPKPRGRPIALDLPEDADIASSCRGVLRALVTGALSPEEALAAARCVEQLRRTAEAAAAAAPRPPDLLGPHNRYGDDLPDDVLRAILGNPDGLVVRPSPAPPPEAPAPEPAAAADPLQSTCILPPSAAAPATPSPRPASDYARPPSGPSNEPPPPTRRRARNRAQNRPYSAWCA